MGATEGITESIKAIPGAIYDLIVYYGSGVIFLFGVVLLFLSPPRIHKELTNINTFEAVTLIVIAIALCYIWGQLSSALSYYVIKRPVSRIVKNINSASKEDFFFNRPNLLDKFPLLQTEEKKKGNYWTILYYIRLVSPEVADDLLKRYARCKLARVNALNFFLLSILHLIVYWVTVTPQNEGEFYSFYHSLWMVLILLFLSLVFAFEFYQRQCWFGDILFKVYAAIERVFENTPNNSTRK
jgi:hypothetical protein